MSESFSPDAVADALGRSGGGFGRGQETYFDHPVLHKSHWRWEIVSYFWAGGIMSGSAVLSVLAKYAGDEDDAALVRSGRWLGFVGSAVSGVLLVKDLGRPERFLNMLRIVKLRSPMSIGVWSLLAFSSAAGLELCDQLGEDRILPFDPAAFVPKVLRDALFAISGALMSSYTGVLVSATAIPAWYHARRHIPATFVCSALSTACAANVALLALGGGSHSTVRKLERIESVAGLCELALLLDWQRRLGRDAQPMFGGATGKALKTWTMLAGICIPLLLNVPAWLPRRPASRFRLSAVLGAGLVLYGGYVLRRSVIAAGRTSADDPRPVLRRPS